jgi:hypothetical protein
MTEQEYRDYNAINYSKLAQVDKDPKYVNAIREKSLALIEGSALDVYMFSKKEFFDKFYILNENIKIGEKPLKIANELFNLYPTTFWKHLDINEVIELGKKYEFQGKKLTDEFKPDAAEKYFLKLEAAIKPYYEELLKTTGKDIISQELYTWIQLASEELLTNEFTSKYFKNRDKNIKITFQKAIIWDFEDRHCKSLLDIEVKNDVEKWVYMVDMKKSAKKDMESSFYKWKYYLQAAFYKEALVKEAKRRNLIISETIIFVDHFGRKFYERYKVIGTFQAKIK